MHNLPSELLIETQSYTASAITDIDIKLCYGENVDPAVLASR